MTPSRAVHHFKDEKKRLKSAWGTEYKALTKLAKKLEREEKLRILTDQLSERQRENWIDWPDLRNLIVHDS
eukprot:COSAG02_NODE_5109_length_4620_cov_3.383765_6_plen_71_part_00